VTALLVVVGAAVGAPLRYLVEVLVRWWLRADDDAFPVGTLAVNLVGSALVGVLAGATAGRPGTDAVTALVGTGFLGALTTYSAFSVQTVRMLTTGRVARAVAYAVGGLASGTALCAAGWVLGRALS
jgi:CrcB protein